MASVIEHLIYAAPSTVSKPQTVDFDTPGSGVYAKNGGGHTVLSGDVVLVVPSQANTTTGTWTVDGTAIGATFSSVGRYNTGVSSTPSIEVFKGTATGDGTISIDFSATWTSGWDAYLLRGVTDDTVIAMSSGQPGSTITGPSEDGALGQIVINIGVIRITSLGAWNLFETYTPSGGWTTSTPQSGSPTTHGGAWRIPAGAAESHSVYDAGASAYYRLVQVVVGTATPSGITGTIAGTAPLGVGSLTGTAATTGTLSGTAPLGVGAFTGTAATTGTIAATAPMGVGSFDGTSDSTIVGTIAGEAPMGAGSLVGTAPTTGTLAGAAPMGSGAIVGDTGVPTLLLSAPSPIGAALSAFELSGPPSDVLVLSAPSPVGAALRIHPVAVPLPAAITDHPIMRRAHLMPPKTEAEPRRMGDALRTRAEGSDGYLYPIEESEVGRLRVFASGIDVTYWTGAPTTVHDWSFGKPFNCQAASFTLPLREWQVPGVGALSVLWEDASVEIMLEDSEGGLTSLWDGFTAEETDVAAPGQTGVTWHCEGTLHQAAHWPHDPPVIMDPRDVGHVIADAMNSVPNHRYAKFARFTTGVLTEDRGDSSMSVLEYCAALIGKTFSDDGDQLMFRRAGSFGYYIDWCLPAVTPHWTYTKGSPGFASSLKRPHSSRKDALFGRGFAPDGGFWKGQVFPGLVAAMPPAYPMANPSESMSVGTTDADTVTGLGVTTWQRKMRERGYPVVVDGVMNAADTPWVRKVQRDQGLDDDGVLGPQTWAGSWEGGERTPETLTYRLPLVVKDTARPYDYDASGKILRANPLFDKRAIVYATPEVDAGTNIAKSSFIPLADKILAREATPGCVGSMTATGVDPWEVGASRLLITAGDNVEVLGHHGGTILQLADVTHTPTTTRMTGDTRARGQAVVDAIMARQRDALRSLYAKQSRTTDRGTLNASQLGQYESESPAGKYSRTAINGDHGLWTVRCIYVAEQGLARFRLTTSPRAEIVTLILGRRATPNQVAAICPDPLDSDAGWYDAEEELRTRFGLVEVCGTANNPGGYFPKQKGDAGATLTGVQAVGNLSMKSQRGGFFWVASFTSRSTFLEGEFEPEVPL